MPDFDKLRETLERKGYQVSCFDTAAQAADYLDGALDGRTIGFGGTMTVPQMGLVDRLKTHNQLFATWLGGTRQDGRTVQVYISSVNGRAETGELINIDGVGNRVSEGLFGHEKVIFIVGRNKIAPDYDAALWRARNIAGPKNAQRLGKKTPCAAKADRCYDCQSPDRVCNALVVYWRKPEGMDYEIVLVNEELGF